MHQEDHAPYFVRLSVENLKIDGKEGGEWFESQLKKWAAKDIPIRLFGNCDQADIERIVKKALIEQVEEQIEILNSQLK